jgi:hypothetical protein
MATAFAAATKLTKSPRGTCVGKIPQYPIWYGHPVFYTANGPTRKAPKLNPYKTWVHIFKDILYKGNQKRANIGSRFSALEGKGS